MTEYCVGYLGQRAQVNHQTKLFANFVRKHLVFYVVFKILLCSFTFTYQLNS